MCLQPISAWHYTFTSDLTGQEIKKIYFYKPNIDSKGSCFESIKEIKLKCGKCFECLQQYSNEWSYRIMCENLYHKESCFITLTYAKDPYFVRKRDLQLFLKRLRKFLAPQKIRYFACGEYGSKGKRPHYHLIIFGWCPNDLEYFYTTKKKEKIYKSNIVFRIWNKGFVSVGKLTLHSAKYCAKYLQKLDNFNIPGVNSFVTMSLKPGIGFNYILDHKDSILNTDKIYMEGKYIRTPRYFKDVLQKKGYDTSYIDNIRLLNMENFQQLTEEQLNNKILKYKKKFGVFCFTNKKKDVIIKVPKNKLGQDLF